MDQSRAFIGVLPNAEKLDFFVNSLMSLFKCCFPLITEEMRNVEQNFSIASRQPGKGKKFLIFSIRFSRNSFPDVETRCMCSWNN